MGIKVKIQLPHDPTGQNGIARRLPDVVSFVEPKDGDYERPKVAAPYAQNFGQPAQDQQQPAAQAQQSQQSPQLAQPQSQAPVEQTPQ